MNLGQKGPGFIKLCRTELPFRRWLLTTVDPALVTPRELVAGIATYDHHLRTIAEADGSSVGAVAPTSADERARAEASFAEGLAALEARGPAAAVPALTRAAALVPEWIEVRLLLDDLLPMTADDAEPAPEPRRLAVEASRQDVFARPDLLAAWAQAFDGAADITLVVTGVREPADVAALVELAGRCGLDRPDAADVVTVAERHPAAVTSRLGRPVNATVAGTADVGALVAALGARSPAAA
jgi:hypothetical protein